MVGVLFMGVYHAIARHAPPSLTLSLPISAYESLRRHMRHTCTVVVVDLTMMVVAWIGGWYWKLGMILCRYLVVISFLFCCRSWGVYFITSLICFLPSSAEDYNRSKTEF